MTVQREGVGNIEGVFDIDLYGDTREVSVAVRKLARQELFLPKADETEEDKALREEYLEKFVAGYETLFEDGENGDFFEEAT